MEKFAFIIHPLDIEDVGRKFGPLKYLPGPILEGILKMIPPLHVSLISCVLSESVAEAEALFVGCSLTANLMLSLPEDQVLAKIIKTAQLAAELGAKIVGLGAFTSVVGDGGITVAKHTPIAVTTGNSYTVYTALEGVRYAANLFELDLERAHVAIIGATGSIGSACARILAPDVKFMTLIGRNQNKLQRLSELILTESGLACKVSLEPNSAISSADIVITVTSAVEGVVDAHALKPGAIVCDVARPRDISKQVAESRDDVLVFEGGVVQVPGDVDFNFNFGFPPGTSYACMAETMLLALEGRYENFSLGKELSLERVREIGQLAQKHGFTLAGLRSFERALEESAILAIRDRIPQKRVSKLA